MKKIIMLLCCIFFITGCSAEYELVYENNSFKESLKIISKRTENLINDINNSFNGSYLVDYKIELGDMTEYEYISKYGKGYNKELIDENDIYGFKLGYSYEKDSEYVNSSIVHSLFRDFSISDNFVKANKINNVFNIYPKLDEITISFKTDNNVVETNADKIDNNVYYWNINRDNYANKNIYINYTKKEELITEDGYLTGNIIKYVLMVLGIVVLISIPIIYEKVKKTYN